MKFEDLYSFSNLTLAFKKAAKGKRSHPTVARFIYRLEDNLWKLHNELKNQVYEPGKYVNFYIHEPKRRLISAAPFRDRVVHHAMCNIIEPVFERSFIFDSYANRVGKGTHKAINRTQHFARNFSYFIHIDIQKFFPSIDHDILNRTLSRKISDSKIRILVSKIIDSGGEVHDPGERLLFGDDDLFTSSRKCGLPIGNLTSQFWANVYLNPLDHFVKRTLGVKGYLRYVDDSVLFGNNKNQLWAWKNAIEGYLKDYRLHMHTGHCVSRSEEGIPFLGFVVFPERRRLKRRKGIHFRRKIAKLIKENADECKVDLSWQGWKNYVSYANTVGLQESMFKELFL